VSIEIVEYGFEARQNAPLVELPGRIRYASATECHPEQSPRPPPLVDSLAGKSQQASNLCPGQRRPFNFKEFPSLTEPSLPRFRGRIQLGLLGEPIDFGIRHELIEPADQDCHQGFNDLLRRIVRDLV
jgi:hypothetical protein